MDFMGVLTRHFLDAIQPSDLLFNRTVRFLDALSDGDAVGVLLSYGVGFLACAVVGMLYMVLMPAVGVILACCLRRGRCGGGMLEMEHTSRTDAYRRALYCCVVLATGMVLFGNTYMFMMSNAAWGVDRINGTLNSLHSYLTDVPEQFEHMMDESYKTVDEINRTSPKLAMQIHGRLQSGVSLALESVGDMKRYLSHVNARKDLETLKKNLDTLNFTEDHFSRFVTQAISHLTYAMDRIPEHYETLEGYVTALDFSEIFRFVSIYQNLTNFQSAVDNVTWDSLHRLGKDYLENIPQKVTNDTKDVVQHMKNEVENTKKHISNVTSDVLASVLTNVTDTLQQLQRNVNMITPAVERAELISRAVGVVLCCLVLLVVVFNLLGLVLGSLGPGPQIGVIVRSSPANRGGNSLLMSAAFIFLSSWLLMGVVLMLFVPGGTMYALVCKPWKDRQLLKIIASTRLFGFDLGLMLGVDRNLSLTEVYTDCHKNMSLWSTLRMHDLINLEEPLNVSQYTHEILRSINITSIALRRHVEDQIGNLHKSAKDINFTAFTHNVSRILNGQLGSTLETMKEGVEGLNRSNVQNSDLNSKLDWAAIELERARKLIDDKCKERIRELNSTAEKLRYNVDVINATVSQVFQKVVEAQYFLDNNITQIIEAEVDRQLGNVSVTQAEWTNLRQQVAPCGPVARAVDSAENIICENALESLNTFWFSLALCLICFIPSVVFSIMLAKYYRATEAPDRPMDGPNPLSEASTVFDWHDWYDWSS